MSNKKFRQDFFKDSTPFKYAGIKKKAVRIQPLVDKHSVEDAFINAIIHANMDISDIIYPKTYGAPSSKYCSYQIINVDNSTCVVTIAGGASDNNGMMYERSVFDECKDHILLGIQSNFISFVEKELCCKIIGMDLESNFTRRVVRPLQIQGGKECGNIISDIILLDSNNNEVYISLKDKCGKTISNNGIFGAFKQTESGVLYYSNTTCDQVVDNFKLDTTAICRGLDAYISKTELIQNKNDTTSSFTPEAIKLIHSSFDYGYIIVKNTAKGMKMVDLTTLPRLEDYVGSIQNVIIQYPYYIDDTYRGKRKGTSIKIQTTKNKFIISIRNSSGEIIPNVITLEHQ